MPSFTLPLIWSLVVLRGAALAVTLRSTVPVRARAALRGSMFRLRERGGSRRTIHALPGHQHQYGSSCFTRARFSGRGCLLSFAFGQIAIPIPELDHPVRTSPNRLMTETTIVFAGV
jgi:hypothetical protein